MVLKLVTLDVTNTLLRFKNPPAVQYKDIASLYGVEVDQNLLSKALRENIKEYSKKFPNFGARSEGGYITWWQTVIQETFKKSLPQKKFDSSVISNISFHLLKHFSTIQAYEIIPGSVSLLQLLQKHTVCIGAISNTDKRLETILLGFGLRHYFDFILTSFEANASKPDLEIFKIAREKANSLKIQEIPSSSVLHIGDSLSKDYIGSKNAGWNSLLVSADFREQCSKLNTTPDFKHMFAELSQVEKYVADEL